MFTPNIRPTKHTELKLTKNDQGKSCYFPLTENIENLLFMVNTKKISSRVLEISAKFTRATYSQNYDIFNTFDEINLVFTSKK